MATYPGMSLSGEVRESVSLDEDDLSDVEDEVFIRDGKNGYKFSEDAGLKRPLMAPRRKLSSKPDFASRIKNRPPCRRLCQPCCYVFIGLGLMTALIILTIVLVSLYPLPLEKLKSWIITKTKHRYTEKVLPCADLAVTDVWTLTLPKLTSESVIRAVDINSDGVDDFIFGFGTGDNYNMNPDVYCQMFFNIPPPCGGGLIALNGITGDVIWRKWLGHTIFTIFCDVDVNADGIFDCLATGKGGIFCVINSRNGSIIWKFDNKFNPPQPLILDIYMANFIEDVDNDGVDDVLAAHTSQTDIAKVGHMILISGKTGDEMKRVETPKGIETYFTPQIIANNRSTFVIFGTGSPTSPGNLSVVLLKDITQGVMTNITTLYADDNKGVISPTVLVDITGDGIADIVTSFFNSTTMAFDGYSFKQLWNFTIPNSETLSIPTPGYFNNDNVTDFLVKYQKGPGFPVYYHSETYILDGKTGKSIYEHPIIDTVGSQMGGLTISMEKFGMDWFVFWTGNCKDYEARQDIFEFISGSTNKQQNRANICKLRFNSTMVAKMYALNQFDQPPGVELYSSDNRWDLEYNNSRSPIDEAREFLKIHPEYDRQQVETTPPGNLETTYKAIDPLRNQKPQTNNKHKTQEPEYLNTRNKNVNPNMDPQPKYENDYEQMRLKPKMPYYPQNEDMDTDYPEEEPDAMSLYGSRQSRLQYHPNNRDTRSKKQELDNPHEYDDNESTTKKKSLSEKTHYGIYDYKNVKNARSRLMHDLTNLPTEILRDTYFKNREKQMRKSRFEQRDLKSHKERAKGNEEVKKAIEEEKKKLVNTSMTLWDLESEMEIEDRENGYYRGKRHVYQKFDGVPKITSVGTLVKSINSSTNSIDLVFLTYWLPAIEGAQLVLEKDVQCISEKIKNAMRSKEQSITFQKSTLEELFKKECIEERFKNQKPTDRTDQDNNFSYYNQVAHLNLGQMTVYRIKIECRCQARRRSNEMCPRFLDKEKQSWPSFLGRKGDGYFKRFL
ncbi:uncharacterized protein [Onthophagus taurus]|uniref:uncharacterized protein n=1 Tax=Onthophagus taurus TaxID=166361 RepID=UPI0039BDD224